MLKFTKRRVFAWLAVLSSVPLTIAALSVWAGLEVASPPRRPLQSYQREYLEHPEKHGIDIQHFTASDGTPCLICEPGGNIGTRGEAIRDQLVKRGIVPPGFGGVHGTLVLLHGRCGRKEDYLPIAERLCASGFRCVIPDLPGHGDHPQPIATFGDHEAALPELVLDEAAARYGFPKEPAGLLGMSMGGSVAMHAASRETSPWKALVIISSFDSLAPVLSGNASQKFGPWIGRAVYGGAACVYTQRTGCPLENLRSTDHAAQIHIPTLIAHGSKDTVIPIRSGRILFGALPADTEKKWIEVPGAGHGNVLVTDFPIYSEIAAWMLGHVTPR